MKCDMCFNESETSGLSVNATKWNSTEQRHIISLKVINVCSACKEKIYNGLGNKEEIKDWEETLNNLVNKKEKRK